MGGENFSNAIGGVDMQRGLAFRGHDDDGFSACMRGGREALGSFEKPFCSWRNDAALSPSLIQRELLRQGAYLSPAIEAGLDTTSSVA